MESGRGERWVHFSYLGGGDICTRDLNGKREHGNPGLPGEEGGEGLSPKELTQQKRQKEPPATPSFGARWLKAQASGWQEGCPLKTCRAERGKDNGWQRTRGVRPPAWLAVNIGPSCRATTRSEQAARPQGDQGPALSLAP